MNILIRFAIAFLILLSACTNKSVEPADDLPNIVMIFADDMGYGDAGCYNSESRIPTPNIDRLASEGVMFTDAHTPSSVCSPSRYGLLTGRYSWRTRLKQWVLLGYDETSLIERDRETIGSLLQMAGYRTACVGKWHVGLDWQTKDGYVMKNDSNNYKVDDGVFRENERNVDFSKPLTLGPNDLGFDYSFISMGCTTSDPPYVFIENNKAVAIPTADPPAEYIGLPGFVPGVMDPDWSQEQVDPVFTNKGIDFIEEHLKEHKEKPFFLYLALSSPHIPWMVPDFAKGKTSEGARGDLVYVVDWSVGEINRILEAHGLTDNTLVIFTSDNGPRRGANGHESAWKFRGYKANIWEGGHRVPFIARWPRKIEPGIRNSSVINLTDMFATFAGLTGNANVSGGEDSYDVSEILLGKESVENDTLPRIFHSAKGIFAIRKGQWKLIEGTKGSGSGPFVIHPDSLLSTGQLYDLSVDPYETDDLWEKEPEKVKELLEALQQIKL